MTSCDRRNDLRGAVATAPLTGLDLAQLIIRKRCRTHIDSYSAFAEAAGRTMTGLAGYLTDFGVAWSALDARRPGSRRRDRGRHAPHRRRRVAGQAWPDMTGAVRSLGLHVTALPIRPESLVFGADARSGG
jgi:hypothetical protein